MKRILTLVVAATTLVGLGACSSDSKSSGSKSTNAIDILTPDTSGSDVTFPSGNVTGMPSDECTALAMQFAAVYTQVFAAQGEAADLSKLFGDVAANVPDDLQDDLAVMSKAFADYAQILKDNGNDMSSAEAQAALQALGTPEVQAASDNISAYFDTTCPNN